MSPAFVVMLFLVVLGSLGLLVSWEYRRARKGPVFSMKMARDLDSHRQQTLTRTESVPPGDPWR
jgi:hypothetical protein